MIFSNICNKVVNSISNHIDYDLKCNVAGPQEVLYQDILSSPSAKFGNTPSFLSRFVDYNVKVLAHNTATVLAVAFAASSVFALFALASGPMLSLQTVNLGLSLGCVYVAADFRGHLKEQLNKSSINIFTSSSNVAKIFKKVLPLKICVEREEIVEKQKTLSIVTRLFFAVLTVNSALQEIFPRQ